MPGDGAEVGVSRSVFALSCAKAAAAGSIVSVALGVLFGTQLVEWAGAGARRLRAGKRARVERHDLCPDRACRHELDAE